MCLTIVQTCALIVLLESTSADDLAMRLEGEPASGQAVAKGRNPGAGAGTIRAGVWWRSGGDRLLGQGF